MAQALCASFVHNFTMRSDECPFEGCTNIVGPFPSIRPGTTLADDHQSMLDVIQIVTVIHANWWYLIQNYATPQSLFVVPWCVHGAQLCRDTHPHCHCRSLGVRARALKHLPLLMIFHSLKSELQRPLVCSCRGALLLDITIEPRANFSKVLRHASVHPYVQC